MSWANDPRMKAATFMVGGPLILLALIAAPFLKAFHAERCGPDAYLSGPLHAGIATGLLGGCLTMLGMALVFLVMSRADPHDAQMKRWRNMAAIVGVALLPTAAWAAPALLLDQYCLSDRGADIQAQPWEPLRHHDWAAARKITTSCVNGKGGWVEKATLDFGPGPAVPFPAARISDGVWASTYSHAVLNLRGGSKSLDASSVQPACPEPQRTMLTRLP